MRHAVRGLRRDPVLALTATLTLAVCIGANTAVFSIVNSILLRPLPYPGSERIRWVRERAGKYQLEFGLGADYYSLREQSRIFEDMAAYDTLTLNWNGIEKPVQVDAAQVTPSFFRVMGSQPLMGRYLSPEEQGVKAPPVVVLSYAFWRGHMAGDAQVVGKAITLDRMPNTIIGVMPQGFDYPAGTQIWRPLPMDEAAQRPRSVMRPMRMVNMLARVKAGVGRRMLDTELSRLAHTIRAEYPKDFETAGFLAGMAIRAQPLQERLTGDVRPALMVLSGAVGLVLLIACVNVANLLLARASARQRELAVRLALGSGPGRIIRQMLTESALLALPGGLAGVAVAYLAVEGLNAWKPLMLARYPAVSMDLAALAFTLGLTLATGLLFGMAPAVMAARVSIHEALKSGGHVQSGGRLVTRLRHLLVVAELGVSLVLLIGAGLLARSFLKLASADLGFPAPNLLTMRVNLVGPENGGGPAASLYATAESQLRFYDDVLDRVKALPMVLAAAVSTDVPLSPEGFYQEGDFRVAGRTPVARAQRPHADFSVVSRDFFHTMKIPLLRGRTFDAQDIQGSPDRIVINEVLARKIFAGENPLGRRILTGENDVNGWTIIGIVGNVRARDLGAEPEPLLYRCLCQSHTPFLSRMAFIVRTARDPEAAIRAVESQVYAVDRNQPVFDVRTMEERLARSLAPQRFYLLIVGIFACIAIVLASLGIYGVMSYLVTRRTREIGIRIAMGAQPVQVERLVLGESVTLAVVAALAGLGGAWGLTRYLKSMLYGVTALDGATFAAMPVVLIAIAAAAAFIPARRASRVDPLAALR
ncbi:MAG TPA: ABC transporter permease [Bryobacteraceae bacterium]|nr:ABC transporter permease [Bryobacteraceae bacterium]